MAVLDREQRHLNRQGWTAYTLTSRPAPSGRAALREPRLAVYTATSSGSTRAASLSR